jgi:hypothetical protein
MPASPRPENRKWEGGNRQANPQGFFHRGRAGMGIKKIKKQEL